MIVGSVSILDQRHNRVRAGVERDYAKVEDSLRLALDVTKDMSWPLSLPWQDKEVNDVVRSRLKMCNEVLSTLKQMQGRIDRSTTSSNFSDLTETISKDKDPLAVLASMQS